MLVTLAKSAGFCFGVQRAVDEVFDRLEKKEKVCTLGPIIHNQQLVDSLKQKGVYIIDELEENLEKKTIIIRSHGVSPKIIEQAKTQNMNIVDMTCPFVSKIHKIVAGIDEENVMLIIAGDESHPEIKGIIGNCKIPYFCIQNEEALEIFLEKVQEKNYKTYYMVAQTTFNKKTWDKICKISNKVCTNLIKFDTICNATNQRQKEAEEIAKNSDLMIVIGGRHSSNTTKLGEICAQFTKTLVVETADELKNLDLTNYHAIGITAGASTPAYIIKEVQAIMDENMMNQGELSFEEMLNQSFKTITTGEKVTAIVTAIADNEITVDVGTKHTGYLPISELSNDPSAKTSDFAQIGDEMELIVIRVNDIEGTAMLSKKRVDALKGMDTVVAALDNGDVLEAFVTEIVNGGIIVTTHGVKVFVPASHTSLGRIEDLNVLHKKPTSIKILEIKGEGRRRKIVGSIKAVLKEGRKELQDKVWATLKVGEKYTGEVKSLTNYGAFVDIGGVDGMVHISELSWSKVKHPSDILTVGQKIEVYIKDMSDETKKIALGFKNQLENPWKKAENELKEGDVKTVKIVSLTPFGAFAEIMPGIDGLIHISQIADKKIGKPADILSVGQLVDAKLTEVDLENKRIGLSIRALLEDGVDIDATQDIE